jgi:hypothetical protein
MTGREVLRDKYGTVIGEIRIEGPKHTLWDRHFNPLGEYNAHTDWTRDKYGNVIGRGNLLVTLLK